MCLPMWCYTTDRTTSIWRNTTTIIRCYATPRTAPLQSDATLPTSSDVMLDHGPNHFNLTQHYHHHPMWCYTTDRTTSIWRNTTTITRCDATPRTFQSDATLPPSSDMMLRQGPHHYNMRQHYHYNPMWCYTPRTAPLQSDATLQPSSDVMLHHGPHHFNLTQHFHHHLIWCYTTDRTTSKWGNTTTIIRCDATPRTTPLQYDATLQASSYVMLHHGPHHFNLTQHYHHHPMWCYTTDRTTSIWSSTTTIIRCDATPRTAPLQYEATLPPSSDVMLHHGPHHFNLKQHYHHNPMWCYTMDRITSTWGNTTTIILCHATSRTAPLQSEGTLPPSSDVMLDLGPHHFNMRQHYHHRPLWCYTTDHTTSIWPNTTTIIWYDATPGTAPLQYEATLPL